MRNISFSIFASLVGIVLLSSAVSADDPFGGPPSASSGDGRTTWGAIYVGDQCSPSIKFPAGATLWFKADTWRDYNIQVWVDDDPQWGAAFKYFENYQAPQTSDQSPNRLNGFWLRVYAPDALAPNYWYPEGSRMDLLTTENGIRPDGSEVRYVGMANNNKFVTDHLLWYEARFDGWTYFQVFNKMMWDNNAIVCTRRIKRPDPPAPPQQQENKNQPPNNGWQDPLDKLPPGEGWGG